MYLDYGQQPFKHLTATAALRELRHLLGLIGVKEAGRHRTHDIRRGHAKDMQLNGATLYQILKAGEWSSPAFLKYMDMVELEMGATMEAHGETMEAHMCESSSEDVSEA